MEKIKYFDTLVIDNGNNCIHLCSNANISDVVYTNDIDNLVMINEQGYADGNLPLTLYEEDFDNIYCEDEEGEYEFVKVEDIWDDEPKKYHYSKVEFDDLDHYKELNTEHGIRQEYYDITDSEIIPCDVFKADDYVEQNYPHQEMEHFYKAVSEEDGKIYYIKHTSPFFPDDSEDVYEFIDEDTFDNYD